jgi:single-stranded DNA-binding protein
MQIKLGEYVFIVGAAGKDAEFRHVGDKNTALTTFSLAVGKDAEDKTKWAECNAWTKLSSYAVGIKKGDIVLAIGTIKSNVSESNGKTYNTLNCEFVCNPAVPVQMTEANCDDFVEITGEGMYTPESDLPF